MQLIIRIVVYAYMIKTDKHIYLYNEDRGRGKLMTIYLKIQERYFQSSTHLKNMQLKIIEKENRVKKKKLMTFKIFKQDT